MPKHEKFEDSGLGINLLAGIVANRSAVEKVSRRIHTSARGVYKMAKKMAGFHYDAESGTLVGYSGKRDFNRATETLPEDSELIVIGSAEDLEQLSATQILDLHNAAVAEEDQVKKFKNKATAIEATFPLLTAAATEGEAPSAEDAKAAKATRKPKGDGAVGRKSIYSGKKVVRNQKDNPRRAGTHGFRAWEAIRDGMTVEEYAKELKERGIPGGLKHLDWDAKRNRVTVE